jgi:hypothetical protein
MAAGGASRRPPAGRAWEPHGRVLLNKVLTFTSIPIMISGSNYCIYVCDTPDTKRRSLNGVPAGGGHDTLDVLASRC